MLKFRTRKTVVKRFKITKTGKVIGRHPGGRHLKESKRKSRIRRQKEPLQIKGTYAKKIKKLLGV